MKDDYCFGFSGTSLGEEQPRGGTWFTVRYARKKGRAIVLIFPDGSIKQTSSQSASNK